VPADAGQTAAVQKFSADLKAAIEGSEAGDVPPY
jgi:hypothetical protein